MGVLGTLAAMVWAHGSWVSSVNVTLAETGRAVTTATEGVSRNRDAVQTLESAVVRTEAGVASVRADNARLETLTNELSRHVGDLREVSAELKAHALKLTK